VHRQAVFVLHPAKVYYEKMELQMNTHTFILIALLAAALSWWLAIHLNAEKQLKKQYRKNELERLERVERVRRLTGKL
jgi:hypothetical protein